MFFKSRLEKCKKKFTAGYYNVTETTIRYRARGTHKADLLYRSSVYDAKVVDGEEVPCFDPSNDGIYIDGNIWYSV